MTAPATPTLPSRLLCGSLLALALAGLALLPGAWAGRSLLLALAAAIGLAAGGSGRPGLGHWGSIGESLLRCGLCLLVLLPAALLAEFVLAPALRLLTRDGGLGPVLLLATALLLQLFCWWRWWPTPTLVWSDALESERSRWASLQLERRLLLRDRDHFWQLGLWQALLLSLPLVGAGWLAEQHRALQSWPLLSAIALALPLLGWGLLRLRRMQPRVRPQPASAWSFLDGEQGVESAADEAEAAAAEAGVEPSTNDPAGQLLQAAGRGDATAIEAALAAGADANARPELSDADQRDALSRAAASGQVSAVRALLAAGARVDGGIGPREDRTTPLLAATQASFCGRIEVVNALLANGADANVHDAAGRTPLHHAALSRDPGVAQALLDAGARIDALDHEARSPLAAALEQGNLPLAELLLRQQASLEPADGMPVLLALAQATDDRVEALNLLRKYKPRLDVCDELGRDALQLAALHGHAGLVEALLEAGSPVRHRCHAGRTALHWAAAGGQARTLQRLTFLGPPPDVADHAGDTALHVAVRAEQPSTEVVRLLLAMGVPPERQNGSGKRALDLAVDAACWTLVRVLDPSVAVPSSFVADEAEPEAQPATAIDPGAVLIEALQRGRPQLAIELLHSTPVAAEGLAAALPLVDEDMRATLLPALFEAGLEPLTGDPAPLDRLLAERPLRRWLVEACLGRVAEQARHRAALLLARARCEPEAEDWLQQQLARVIANAAPNARDPVRRTALHHALRRRSDGFVEALLRAGASLNARDAAGYTPLHELALRAGADADRLRFARILIQAGADPAVRAADGSTPTGLAAGRGLVALAELLDWPTLAHPGRALKEADLARAARAGDRGTLARLLQLGLPVDGRDERGATALIHAAGAGQLALVTDLIGAGADTDAATLSGATALSAACVSGHLPVIGLLLDAGVPVDQPMRQGLTPLMVAASVLRSEVVELLLARGARVDARAESGLSALEAAVLSVLNQGSEEGLPCIKLLLERRAPVETAGPGKPGLLHRILGAEQNRPPAAETLLLALLRLLLPRGADPNRRDERGRSALHWACRHSLLQVIEALLAAGAEPQTPDSLKQLPWDLLPPKLRPQYAAALGPRGGRR